MDREGDVRRSLRSPGRGEQNENHIVEVVDCAGNSWPKPLIVWQKTWRGKEQLAAERGMMPSPAGDERIRLIVITGT